MHVYSTEFRHSKIVHIGLAIVAAIISYFVNTLLTNYDWRIVGSISFFTIFAAVELLFEKYIWKAVVRLPFASLQNISGHWEGKIFVGTKNEEYPASLDISQTWSRMVIEFQSGNKGGSSISSSIFFDRINDQRVELIYNYEARDKQNNHRHGFDHHGTAILALNKSCNRLEGNYFTQKTRNSFGTLDLYRVEKKTNPTVWIIALTAVIVAVLFYFLVNS